ncbi:hypothetical protein SAY86_024008 [Trapa natans]|uniref:AAA+ ATPase domain-containing protein n=1 Tax=Trapa natans TaxID=22666 RepID=A0AAN7LQT1_TRANT|nr:hypothetical protein SAY86_024008 [Trapa natans]
MTKRNAFMVLSSDEEDEKSSSKLKSFFCRSDSKGQKQPCFSVPRSRSCKQSRIADEFELFGEDFKEVFTGVKVSNGSGTGTRKELWADRYKPCTFEDLAVHKKKVDEVKAWFEQKIQVSKGNHDSNVLLITGPAGVGKSATVKVIASHLGAMLFEWRVPTPTIWQEHMYSSNTGMQYISKLDEFEIFVERIRNYGLVSPSITGRPLSPVILLIDDLPLTFSRIAYTRLKNSLHLLVRSACSPTVILITDTDHSDSANDTTRNFEELKSFLEEVGARKISFNPITSSSIKRTLSKVCKQERCHVTAEQLDLIAKASGGDIRQAIASLQLFSINKNVSTNPTLSDSAERKDGNPSGILFGRDETLSLFHALGKFLHNKRERESTDFLDEDTFPIRDKFSRLPLKMDSPEKVLCQAHGQARPITDFLHENVLDFIDGDAVDDACVVLSYLCDVDVLLAIHQKNFSKNSDTEKVLQSCAASIAVRGILFGNDHPAPPRWHSIRKPKLWQVEKTALHNKDKLLWQRDKFHHSSDLSVIATEYTPVHRQIQHKQPDIRSATSMENSGAAGDGDDDTSMETDAFDDDEIEDW